jgi:small subunit ribosomal protein S15
MTPEERAEIFQKFARGPKDTGSPEVQVALLSKHIQNISAHLSFHKKDFHSRRGLLQMVSRRRKLLDYLKRENQQSYETLIQTLGLRR